MTVAHVHGSQKAYLDMQFVHNRNNEPFLHMNWMSRALIIHTIPIFKHFWTFWIRNTTGAQLVEYDTKLHHKMCLYSFESKTSKLVDVSAVEIVLYQWMNEANEHKQPTLTWGKNPSTYCELRERERERAKAKYYWFLVLFVSTTHGYTVHTLYLVEYLIHAVPS